jgi:hypothetical protein
MKKAKPTYSTYSELATAKYTATTTTIYILASSKGRQRGGKAL